MNAGISILIPCWNSRELLEANLPSVREAMARLEVPSELIVVDDASSDGTGEWLARAHGWVRVLAHARNRGFSRAVQTGLAAAGHGIVYLLNSDVRLEPDALRALIPHFENPEVFAVASLDVERSPLQVPAFTDHAGLLGVRYVAIGEPKAAVPVAFATGGHSAYRTEYFRALGGFDRLFAPIYWEDVDCCARARARGWSVWLEPGSRVHHSPGGTMSRRRTPSVIAGYRAAHRWLFTLRHSPRLGPLSVLILAAAHPGEWVGALGKGLRRSFLIRRRARRSIGALAGEGVSPVKRRHGHPWTVAYLSPTGEIAGGGEWSLLTLLRHLDRDRVRPLLVCPDEGSLTRRAREEGIAVRTLPLPSTFKGFCDGSIKRISRMLLDEGADLVHANASGRILLLGGMAAGLLGIPLIWHVRIADAEPVADGIGAALSKRMIVTSGFVAKRFARGGVRGKIALVPNPVDIDAFRVPQDTGAWRRGLGIPPDRICVGLFGRFDAWKRFELAVRAAGIARGREARLHLVCVGDGPERAALERAAEASGLGGAVSFAGWQPDAAQAFAGVDIVIHPTPGEHFGRVFIEAMAAGRPVVAVRSGAAPEIITEGTGILVRPEDPQALADALVALAGDPPRRAAMGLEGSREAQRRFAAAPVARAVEDVYAQILTAGGEGTAQGGIR